MTGQRVSRAEQQDECDECGYPFDIGDWVLLADYTGETVFCGAGCRNRAQARARRAREVASD